MYITSLNLLRSFESIMAFMPSMFLTTILKKENSQICMKVCLKFLKVYLSSINWGFSNSYMSLLFYLVFAKSSSNASILLSLLSIFYFLLIIFGFSLYTSYCSYKMLQQNLIIYFSVLGSIPCLMSSERDKTTIFLCMREMYFI